ncbi:MAG: hypothetical protein J1F64_11420 [Oscillospiraceae bacterium]|nr:hypothetical protein [Oscillospiraceae bacterium]
MNAEKKNEGYYEDAHGNKIYGKRDNLSFVFTGYDSEVRIGENLKVSGNFEICMGAGSIVKIGDNVKLNCSEITVQDNSILSIGDGSEILYYIQKPIWKRGIISK